MDTKDPVAVLSAMSSADWAFVALASAIILAILGPRMIRDVRGWVA